MSGKLTDERISPPGKAFIASLFSVAIFLAASLLFLVQPMIARMVLPQFGGSPAVWTTCMLFFQILLLAGYAYSHLAWRVLGRKSQVFLHFVVLLAPFGLLPFAVSTAWAPEGKAEPSLLLLGLLTVSVGLPFFVVATSSPLIQAWYAAVQGKDSKDPYWLYAASNAGSLFALLGYPLAVQPLLTLQVQSRVWAVGYLGLVVVLAGCGWMVLKSHRNGEAKGLEIADDSVKPGGWLRLRWTVFALLPSSLMLGLTAHLTTDFPPVPMLWIIPLSLYLLSFIVCFSGRSFPSRRWVIRAMGPAILVLVYQVTHSGPPSAAAWALLFLAFFVLALGFHGELWVDRPDARHLTEFYLWISLGGALGGVLNSIVAPRLFNWVAEYPMILAIAGVLTPALGPIRRSKALLAWDVLIPLGLLGVVLAWGSLASSLGVLVPSVRSRLASIDEVVELRYAIPLCACLFLAGRPHRFGLAVALILAAWHVRADSDGKLLDRERTFFGVLRVIESPPNRHRLIHGSVIHGEQWQSADPRLRDRPLLCFYPTGPIGQVFRDVLLRRPPKPVGVVGLGAGSLASYGVPDQIFDYFEIDPAVERIARDPRFFTFLRDSKARCRVVIGDARLTLKREPDRHYGTLIVDAFSGDTIPVHLLTREALKIYLTKLADGGLLAFHISNIFLDLEPVMAGLAASEGLTVRVRMDDELTRDEVYLGKMPSRWVVMARREADLGALAADPRWKAPASRPGRFVWTDDFSNPLELIMWK